MDQSSVDRPRIGQYLVEEARHTGTIDGPYASFRKSERYDCNVRSCIWVAVVGV